MSYLIFISNYFIIERILLKKHIVYIINCILCYKYSIQIESFQHKIEFLYRFRYFFVKCAWLKGSSRLTFLPNAYAFADPTHPDFS